MLNTAILKQALRQHIARYFVQKDTFHCVTAFIRST